MIVRLKFEKKLGPIRFVGHLDMMRTFQKVFMRSGIPVAYSEGFNPHQQFSFATALAVGISSEAEYIDLKLSEEVDLNELITSINEQAPLGIRITKGVVLPDKHPKAMAALRAAKYLVTFDNHTMLDHETIDNFLKEESIVVKKKNKKGKINDFDIRPGIFSLEALNDSYLMTIASGSQLNVKPEMVLTELYKSVGKELTRSDYSLHRIELYHENDGLKSLIDI